jgi:3-hydroxyisobutyrate dehydrogenase-like beta-hydroxyacid dehydrogenase
MSGVPLVAIVAAGNMGAAVAKRLGEHGVKVVTTLDGRGAASAARARDAGMSDVPRDRLCEAQFVLSILPPSSALAFAQLMAPVLQGAARRPVFVDCNAVSPETAREIGAVVGATGAPFIDAAIIGLPPKAGGPSPHFYASGAVAARLQDLSSYGLDVRVLDGPAGAASALKMCYAGINKGVCAIAAAMILAAARSGASAALRQEMSESLPGLLNSLQRQVPDMLPKAYRWVGEMREIANFVGDDTAAAEVYGGCAQLFQHVAEDVAGEKRAASELVDFFLNPG